MVSWGNGEDSINLRAHDAEQARMIANYGRGMSRSVLTDDFEFLPSPLHGGEAAVVVRDRLAGCSRIFSFAARSDADVDSIIARWAADSLAKFPVRGGE